jgi:hypothetical protein
MNSFSEYLNSFVRNHSDSVSKIAQNACLSRPSLYDLINGKTLPRKSTLENICNALSLSEKSSRKLRDLINLERFRTSRKEHEDYLYRKKNLTSEISTLLLSKGHEISRPKGLREADLVLRQNAQRYPILICPSMVDHSNILGNLLISMFHLSANKGYVCTPEIKSVDRTTNQLFSSHQIMILSIKGMMREFNSFL